MWSRPELVPVARGKDASANLKINKEQYPVVSISHQACDLFAPPCNQRRSMTNSGAYLRVLYGGNQG